jgi:hypothetical protein
LRAFAKFKRPYFGSLLILPGLIDNSRLCFMNGQGCRPNKSPSRVVSTGETSDQIRYRQGQELMNYLVKGLLNNVNATAEAVYGSRQLVISRPSDPPLAEDEKWKM